MAQGDNNHEIMVEADKHSAPWRVCQSHTVDFVSQSVPIMLFLWR